MTASNIEWTDLVWNPVTGCSKVSQGCKNCYAKTVHDKRHKAYQSGKLQHVKQYATPFETVMLHPGRLQDPLKWKKPAKIFVNSMSDLFHEDVPFEFIDAVFSVMADCDQHIYQVLTKRPERMHKFYEWKGRQFNIPWQPSDNVWLGVSVEDQDTANKRIPLLLQVPAAVKFLSCEPLLEPIDFEKSIGHTLKWHAGGLKNCVSWVIVGGESGPHARPMHPYWARSLRDQCKDARVPFFFKQWGEWAPANDHADGKSYTCKGAHSDSKIGSAFGSDEVLAKVGKHKAGNLLDGKQHLQFPKSK